MASDPNAARATGMRWPVTICIVVVLSVYVLPLTNFFASLWERPEYQHFPFIILAFTYIYLTNCCSSLATNSYVSKMPLKGTIGLSLAWILFAVAIGSHSTTLVAFSAILLVSSFAVSIHGDNPPAKLRRLLLLLFLVVPFPLGLDQRLINKMRLWSTHLSSSLLDLIGIDHLADGNTLQLATRELFVDDACSGIVSALSILAVALIYSIWKGRGLLHTILLITSSFAWSIIMNVSRISIIVFSEHFWRLDLATGAQHDVLGLVLFAATTALLFSTDQFLDFALGNIQSREQRSRLITIWNRFVGAGKANAAVGIQPAKALAELVRATGNTLTIPRATIAAALFVPLAGAQFVLSPFDSTTIDETLPVRINNLDLQIPPTLANFSVQSSSKVVRTENDMFGNFSHTYTLHNPEQQLAALVSFDFPYYSGWHDLDFCYTSVGWKRLERGVAEFADGWNGIYAKYKKNDKEGFLVYSEFDANGKTVSPPLNPKMEFLWRHHRQHEPSLKQLLFQVQVWVEGTSLSDDQMVAARELLIASRVHFLAAVVKNGGN